MATVTSFAEFLTAIAGSEDIVLANDIDAQAEGYELISNFAINCNIDGQGHTISNVSLLRNSVIGLVNTVTVENVAFRNLLAKRNNNIIYFINAQYGATLENCKFGAQIDCNSAEWNLSVNYGSTSLTLDHCAIDLTLKNSGNIFGYYFLGDKTTFQYCNVVIREGNMDKPTNQNYVSLQGMRYSAFVFDACKFDSSCSGYNLWGQNSYVALHGCTSDGTVNFPGYSNMYFCNDSDITCTASGVTVLTPEQLRSESYLRSIGFLP